MLLCRFCRRFGVTEEILTPHFFVKIILKLYVISNDGRQAAVAELRRADMFRMRFKEGVTSFRGGFEESVTV